MDEVDKIILYTLHQIDNNIDVDINLTNFTPELVVRAVSACLHEIKPELCDLPRSLPVAMARRFTAATTLAEACSAVGYRGDIGYQTFLYPSVIELRRLLMFLIEQLPRDNSGKTLDYQKQLNDNELLFSEIREKLEQQLSMPWVPQLSRNVANHRQYGCSSLCTKFTPQLNLNVPGIDECTKEEQEYFEQQAPNIFQQTASPQYDLISSVLHKNDLERFGYTLPKTLELQAQLLATSTLFEITTPLEKNNVEETVRIDSKETTSDITIEQLNERVQALRVECDNLLEMRKKKQEELNASKIEEREALAELEKLRPIIKIHERMCLVLEDPNTNISKLEALIETMKAKRVTHEQQWLDYRKPLLDKLEILKSEKQAKNIQNVIELRNNIAQLERELREKTVQHKQLNAMLKNSTQHVAPRKEYTRRIHEFIGNIRKQRADIFKVLDDTRDLQKQLNSVTAQLQRQFNYTDDLLYQSAKHDLHAKRAYKLLALVHQNCNELVEYVTLTGNINKEIRELEVQIDNEKMKNIATSLMQISADIKKFETDIEELQTEIRTIKN